MMRCLKFANPLIIAVFLAACNPNPYRKLPAQRLPAVSALASKAEISRELYRCVADGRFLFKRFHLSGILFFKKMDDGSTRTVFQNEMGIAFFDFKWNIQDSFSVVSIIEQLDKPAVINTLRTDLSLLLMKGLRSKDESIIISKGDTLSRFPVNKGYAYYKRRGKQISRIEYAGKSRITSITLAGIAPDNKLPTGILFRHHKVNFTIDLKRLPHNDN